MSKLKHWARLNIPVFGSTIARFIGWGENIVRNGHHEGHLLLGSGRISEARAVGNERGNGALLRRLDRLEATLERPIHRVNPVQQNGEGMRVLYVANNCLPYTNSGYTVRTQRLLTALQSCGVNVEACTRLNYPVAVGHWPKSFTTEFEGLTYHHLLPWVARSNEDAKFQQAIESLSRLVEKVRPTVLHTTTDFNNASVVSEVARRFGLPWVYEVRGELENTWLSKRPPSVRERAQASEYYERMRAAEDDAVSKANAVVCLSNISKQQLVNRGADPDKIWVVPNSIDETVLGRRFNQDEIREELGLTGLPGPLVGTVTSVVGYEGLHTLIEAMELLPDDVNAVIVGDGEARPDLERVVEERNLNDRVFFVGRKPDTSIWKWYAALDVFVLPRVDSDVTRNVTPIKPLTAMALGIPVVASDLPALREVTGGFATYFPAEDFYALAEKIIVVLEEPLATSDEQASAEIWVRTRTWRSAATETSDIYHFVSSDSSR